MKLKAKAPYADLCADPRKDWEGWKKLKGLLPPPETPTINALARQVMLAGDPPSMLVPAEVIKAATLEAKMLHARASRGRTEPPSGHVVMCRGTRLIPLAGLLTYQRKLNAPGAL